MPALKDLVDGNELDLSLNELTNVPVKEMAVAKKATRVDLSCNFLQTLPNDFATLTHLVKIDLSKNKLTALPENFGNLTGLQYLDLYDNQLVMIPLSFSKLTRLKWLDLKDNPLDSKLKAIAGDCLDEKQCAMCAKKVVGFMQAMGSEIEKEKQKKLQEEKDKEAIQKAREQRELEERRKLKKTEKEKRKAELLKAREVSKQELRSELSHLLKDNSHNSGNMKLEHKEFTKRQPKKSTYWLKIIILLLTVVVMGGTAIVMYGLLQNHDMQDISFTDLQTKFWQYTTEFRDVTAVWWSAFARPYFNSFRSAFLQHVHSILLYASDLATQIKTLIYQYQSDN